MRGETDGPKRRVCGQWDGRRDRGTHFLSVVVGLKDVADGSAVALPARRLQDETEQPAVVLVGRTLNHTGEGELVGTGARGEDTTGKSGIRNVSETKTF